MKWIEFQRPLKIYSRSCAGSSFPHARASTRHTFSIQKFRHCIHSNCSFFHLNRLKNCARCISFIRSSHDEFSSSKEIQSFSVLTICRTLRNFRHTLSALGAQMNKNFADKVCACGIVWRRITDSVCYSVCLFTVAHLLHGLFRLHCVCLHENCVLDSLDSLDAPTLNRHSIAEFYLAKKIYERIKLAIYVIVMTNETVVRVSLFISVR